MGATEIKNGIDATLQKAEQVAKSVPEKVGMFTLKTANRTIQEAAQRPNPRELWLTLWYEGEVCCLFADSNLGKSIYAVQIATHIAETYRDKRVLYFDFELADKQFQVRYTDEAGNLNEFPDNLYRVEINKEALDEGYTEDGIINNIENAALEAKGDVLIIDNLTYLCTASEKGDAAGALMIKLMALKRKHGLSLLVVAHTPKRDMGNPITPNDLAGSKKLYNFFDSVFAIGMSAKDNNLRYIKQLKVRYGNYTYDGDNVIVATIEKIGTFLRFVQQGFAEEKEHLREPSEKEKANINEQIITLHERGKSYRDIAAITGVSKTKIGNIIKSRKV